MKSKISRVGGIGVVACGVVVVGSVFPSANSAELAFRARRIGQFRSEAVCVADFTNDGRLDVLAGAFLYAGPEWKPTQIRTLSGEVDEEGKGYYDDFANLALDVDQDGKLDLVTCGWFSQSVQWYRNPGKEGVWPLAQEIKNGNYEAAHLYDIDGDGKATEILPATRITEWFDIGRLPSGEPGLIKHVVSDRECSFGGGVGDLNGDGHPDILRPEAWYQAPTDARAGDWTEQDWGGIGLGSKDGKAEHTPEMLVHDVNGDGLNDVVTSHAHDRGIFWYEHRRSDQGSSWEQHLIDDSWSQPHSLVLADLTGDGAPELITGKRFMAHNGGDPDAFGPLGVYGYRLTPDPHPTWTRHSISEDQGIGSGVSLCAVDLDADGDVDVIVTGKWGGPVWFENLRK